ncbi:phage tail tape measure protein [Cupriavidus necator]
MNGPNLSLGVSVSGLEQLNALRTAIAETKADLASLSTAGSSLQGLQRAAQTADKVGDDFTALRGDIQKLAGAFETLAVGIRTSLAAITNAAVESTAGVTKQLKAQETQAQKTAANLVANAKFAAMSTRAQARAIISARSQLDIGIDEGAVAKRFGDSAVASARLAESLKTLKEAHYQSAAASKQGGEGMSFFSKQANDAVAAIENINRAQARVASSTLKKAAGSEGYTRVLLGTNLSDQGALKGMSAFYNQQIAENRAGLAKLEAEYQASIAKLDKGVASVMQAATRTGYQPADRAWWDSVIANQEKAQAKLDAAYAQSVGQLEKQVDRVMKAATLPAYTNAGPQWWEKVLADQEKATAKLDIAYQQSIAKLETQVSKVMKAATHAGYTNAGPAWWNQILDEQQAAQAKLEAEYLKSVTKLETQVSKLMKAATKPAYTNAGPKWWEQVLAEQEAGVAKIQAANARFAALPERGQARTVISARSQLDQGVDEAAVKARFGEAALGAARAAESLKALKEAHYGSAAAGTKNSDVLSLFTKNANDAHSAARGLASGFNAMWLTWGNLAPLLAGAAVSNAVVQVGKVGSQVSYQLEFVKQLNNESSATIQAVREQMRALSKDSLFTLDESTKGLTGLVQAGLSAAEAMQVLPHIMNLATVGEMDLKTAGEGLIGIMNAFGIPMDRAAATADKFGKAQQLAQVSVQDYIEAMKYASTVAGQYNQDIDNTFAAITLLGKINIKGTSAGTSYRNFLKDLYDPSVKAKRAMDELGVSAFDTATGKMRPFIEVMQDLKKATDPLTEQGRLKALGQIFSERGGKMAVAALADMNGEYGKLNEQIKNSEGYNQKVADALKGQVGPSFKQAFNAMRASMDEVFQNYEKNYADVAASLKTLFDSEGFKSTLGTIISAVGSLTEFLVDHHRAILLVVEGYIALKVANFLVDILQGVGKAVIFATMNTRLWAASMGEASAASQTLSAVSAAETLRQSGQAAAMGASGLARASAEAGQLATKLPLLSAALGFLTNPIVGLIATLGVLGVTFYQMYTSGEDASNRLKDAVVNDNKVIEGSIDRLIAKERERQKLMSQGTPVLSAEEETLRNTVTRNQQIADQQRDMAKAVRAAGGKEAEARVFDIGEATAVGQVFKAKQELSALEQGRAQLAKEAEERRAKAQKDAEERAKQAARVGGTETFDGSAPKGTKGAYRLDNAEISAAERAYRDQQKLLTDSLSQQRILIDEQKKYRLVTEAEANSQLESLVRSNFEKQLALEAQHEAESLAVLRNARDEAGKVRAQSSVDSAATKRKEVEQAKAAWEARVAIERAGQLNLIKLQTKDFITKADLEQEDFRLRIARELELSQLDAVSAAGRAARYDAEIKYNKEIIRQKVEIADLDRALAQADYEGAGAIIAQIKAREDAIEQLEAAKKANADLAEQTARSSELIKRSWEYGAAGGVRNYLDEVTNAAQRSRDLIEGAFRSLEDALTEFFRRGKLNLRDFVEYMKQQLARNMAQTLMGAVFGGGSGGGAGAAAGGGSGGGLLSTAKDLYGLYDKGNTAYGMISSWLGGSTPAATSGVFGGAGSLTSGVFSAGATAASIYGSGIAAGTAYATNAGLTLYGTGTALSLSGGTAGLSAAAAGSGAAAGAAGSGGMMAGLASVPVAGWIAAAMLAADGLYGAGWTPENTSLNGVGKVIGGPTNFFNDSLTKMGVSGRFANILTGASINSFLFGRQAPKTQSAGIEGAFTANGFEGRQYEDWKAKGGLFRRSKSGTNYADITEGQQSALNSAFTGALNYYKSLDSLTGGSAVRDNLGSFRYEVRADMRGEDSFSKLVLDVSEKLGKHLIPELEKFKQEGESIGDTAQRLAGIFEITNNAATLLGRTATEMFGGGGFGSYQNRQALIDAAGGVDAFTSNLNAYRDAFYSKDELATQAKSTLQNILSQYGQILPSTKADFRALVDSIDVTSASGRELFTVLMKIAPSFSDMIDQLDEQAAAAKAAADALAAFKKQVADFQASLLRSDLSTLTPEQKYAEAKRQYDSTSAAAAAGDAAAQSNWTTIAQAFLEASRAFYASSSQYGADFDKVQGYRVDGSHASGLDYVPKDGYIAELHRGEAVLTASDAARYRATSGAGQQQSDSEVAAELRALRATLEAQHQQSMRVEAAKAKGSSDAREEAKEGNKQIVKTLRQVVEQL